MGNEVEEGNIGTINDEEGCEFQSGEDDEDDRVEDGIGANNI